MLKKTLTGVTIVIISLVLSNFSFGSEGQCTKLLATVCNNCHNTDRVCETMGGTEKKWKAIIDWMISNGAELEDEEIDLLVSCLSQPYDEAKKVCGK